MADMMTFPDTVEEFMEQYKLVDTKQVYTNGSELVPIFRMKQWFEHLSSAQPEIIRCKDCKHWIPYDWMFSEMWQSKNLADYLEDDIGCNLCDMAMKANDFCSRAERREVTT